MNRFFRSDALSTELVHGWAARKLAAAHASDGQSAGSSARWLESPNSWFKRNSYRVLKFHVDEGRSEVFGMAIARSLERRTYALSIVRENPFKVGLFAIWADAELARNDRKVFGDQMLYAHLHNVPPQHLIGFISVAGSPPKIAKKIATNFREPGFD